MLAGLVRGLILSVMVLNISACLSSSDDSSGEAEETTYQYVMEGDDDLWGEDSLKHLKLTPTSQSDWQIKWNENEAGEITGVFVGPWETVEIQGLNNGTTREIYGVPTSPIAPLGVDRVEFSFASGALYGTVTVNFVAFVDGVEHAQAIYPTIEADENGGDGEGEGEIGTISNFSEARGKYQGTLTELTNTNLPQTHSHWGNGSGKICTYSSDTIFWLSTYMVFTTIHNPTENSTEYTIAQSTAFTNQTPGDFETDYFAGYPSTNLTGANGVVMAANNVAPWSSGNGALYFKFEGDFFTSAGTNKLSGNFYVYFADPATAEPICSYSFEGEKLNP